MKRSNLEKYYLSMSKVKKMLKEGLITRLDYQRSEVYLADKYCIKKGNLYRLNDLTYLPKRVIYILPKKEGKNGTETNNQDRSATKVTKEN